MPNSHFVGRVIAVVALAMSCCLFGQGKSSPTATDYQLACVNKRLLLDVVRARDENQLHDILGKIEVADRDIQRLFWTKLYSIRASQQTARHMLALMPQGDADSAQFYAYTYLYDQKESAHNWISAKEADEANDLYNEYYDFVAQLLPQYPDYLDRYLVMLRWLNADMSELIDDWEPSLRKAFGKRYDEEKRRVWGILERPYDPPSKGK